MSSWPTRIDGVTVSMPQSIYDAVAFVPEAELWEPGEVHHVRIWEHQVDPVFVVARYSIFAGDEYIAAQDEIVLIGPGGVYVARCRGYAGY